MHPYNKPNPKISEFVLLHSTDMTYEKMARTLKVNVSTVKKYGKRLGIIDKRPVRIEKKKIALLIEYFSNGLPVSRAAKILGISSDHACTLIEKHYFFKQRSYCTVTYVIESKMNYI